MENKTIYALPKVELHCHLDGSVGIATIREIYEKQGKPLAMTDEEIEKLVIAPERCKDLTEYLSCFQLITRGLNNRIALRLAIFDVARRASEENVCYLEVRFSPKHLETDSFSMEEIVECIIEGTIAAEKNYKIKIGLILCCMRGQTFSVNQKIVWLAYRYLGEKVVAIDLAGNEQKYPTKNYRDIFLLATKLGIPFTIHAGETGNIENVEKAIEYGAKRIGHGIALAQSEAAMNRAMKENILLEMCPVCNIQTGAAKDWQTYPVDIFQKFGLNICFNTDNRTVSNTSLTNEFMQVDRFCKKISLLQAAAQTKKAIRFLFTDNLIKEDLIRQVNQYLQ